MSFLKDKYAVLTIADCVSDSGLIEHINTGVSLDRMGFQFRLCDDDGVPYFYGWSATNDDEDAFLPLDDYGEAYGCTYIEYLNPVTYKWEML
jgi:hypothetical protein